MDGTKYNQRFQIESSDIEPIKWENQKIFKYRRRTEPAEKGHLL